MAASEVRNDVMNLINKRDQIEREIREMGTILSQNGVGMDDPLVDNEGYPLAHIDVYQVRHARNRIICLQNDHKAIMREIERGLGVYYANTGDHSAPVEPTAPRPDYSMMEPFARISDVAQGSPADEAGLQNNDLIIEFGSIIASNYKDITTIADVVRHSENVDILVRVKRENRVIPTHLRPRKWNGKGLLGCHIASLDSVDR